MPAASIDRDERRRRYFRTARRAMLRMAGALPVTLADSESPTTPANLAATAASTSQIDLAWDASTDNVRVLRYNIYRDGAFIAWSATNAYSDTGLEPDTEYTYEVSAVDLASNESARSDPDSATTDAP